MTCDVCVCVCVCVPRGLETTVQRRRSRNHMEEQLAFTLLVARCKLLSLRVQILVLRHESRNWLVILRFRCMLGKEALARTLLFGAFEANKTIDISTNRMPFAVHPSQALQHLLEEWEVRWLRFARRTVHCSLLIRQ